MDKEVCPVCGEGTLTEHLEKNNIDGIEVDMLFSTCDVCHSEVANAEQSRRNKRAYIIAKQGEYDFL